MSSVVTNAVQINQSATPAQNIHFRAAGTQDFRLSTGNIGAPIVDEVIIDTTSVRIARLALTPANLNAADFEVRMFFMSAS